MKNVRFILFILWIPLMITVFFSCGETAPTREVGRIDSLNYASYIYRYKILDSAYQNALAAYKDTRFYSQGKAEACNNLGFCAFMRMNFETAINYHKEALRITPNELERLIADIGLMKVYQRTAMNKEFYDARNSALRRMKRIGEDKTVFVEPHELLRLNYAFSEFYIVSAVYYYYLQQRQEALAAMGKIKVDEALTKDTSQLLYYFYIKGSTGLIREENFADRKIQQFDYLFKCWQLSVRHHYLYFEANSLQGIAELMNENRIRELLIKNRNRALRLLNPENVTDSLLPLYLAKEALKGFQEYGDLYQIAGTYRLMGTYYNIHGRYDEAFSVLSKALDYVNRHHALYYHCTDTADRLKPFIPQDTAFSELTWLAQEEIKTVPEWILRIREQLSVAYGGLGEKVASDYNRNIYLDILNHIRQDKELESRYFFLERESRQLTLVMFLVIAGIVVTVLLFGILNSRWKKRNQRHIERLKVTLDVCQKITASIPLQTESIEDIVKNVTASVFPDFRLLFGAVAVRIYFVEKESEYGGEGREKEQAKEREAEEKAESGQSEYAGEITVIDLTIPGKKEPIGKMEINTLHKLKREDCTLINVIVPYIVWVLENGLTSVCLGDERKRLEKQRYIYEQHIADNKRQNLIKKACLSIVTGITPYLDRAINEVGKIRRLINERKREKEIENIESSTLIRNKYQYVNELFDKINEYNDILALWIKMKHGTLNLNIENFSLNELFEVLQKSRKTYEMKKQSFHVEPIQAVVKADKALTLFMLNTLTENARKYTPEGGKINVYAKEEPDYVEISVEDNGRGLQKEDISLLLNEKAYDSRLIGMREEEDEELKKAKGSGFGLMNCQGIIEKYRKTNELFKVCLFGIESVPGKGSRFFFRLPKGVRKLFTILVSVICSSLWASSGSDTLDYRREVIYNELLDEASLFADSAYYSNVDRNYRIALQYIDSAINRLNRHYEEFAVRPHRPLRLKGEGLPAEIFWWNETFNTAYDIILDIRNEAAVAFLALRDWEGYTYNNEGYTNLYKLTSEDNSLEEYCRKLQHSSNNKTVGIIICVLLLLALLAGYYILYFRRRLVNRMNLEQVLEINRQIFSVSSVCSQEPENEMSILERIVKEIYESVNELLIIDALAIAVYEEDSRRLRFAFNPPEPQEKEILKRQMEKSFEQRRLLSSEDKLFLSLPLRVDVGADQKYIGVLALRKQMDAEQEEDRLLFELIARYVAIVVFNAVIKLADQYRDIEMAEDETRRAAWENSQLHVQNMVLDNCLSTIKHETIYYPNKIKQIIGKLNLSAPEAEYKEQIETIDELISYYKDIFTVLSACASRQLEDVTFRRGTVSADELAEHAVRYLKKAGKRISFRLNLETEMTGLKVAGDKIQLKFLLENLLDEAIGYPVEGTLKLKIVSEKEFVCFSFIDPRREKSREELNRLFYPDLIRMSSGTEEKLSGTEYLVCKQIIRDHDEYAGRRGCRINAEPYGEGGFMVYFTLPQK